jgi:hypothetical protein
MHKFVPKVANQTSINFTKEEFTLLNKGLQYNLHSKNKNWFKNLAIEADTAISMADVNDQDFLKRTIAKQLRNIAQNSTESHHKKQKFVTEKRILRTIKEKLEFNNACISSADKGKTIVVLSRSDYSEKISQFVNDNKFEKIDTDPTTLFQKQANQAIQRSIIIRNEQKWKLKNMNPTPPPL